MSPTKRALNEPEDNLANKRPRSSGLHASLEGGEDDEYGDGEPSRPLRTDPRIARQAQGMPSASRLDSHQRRYAATASIAAESSIDEDSSTTAYERSTLGLDKTTNIGSERAIGARRKTMHSSGSVESQWDSACAPIDRALLRGSEVGISRLYLEKGDRDPSSTEVLKSKGKEREVFANTNSTQPTTFHNTNQGCIGQSFLLQSSQDYEDIPAPPITRSPRHCNQQDMPNLDTWYGAPTNGEGSLSSNSTTNPLWGLDDDELDASLERLDEYFTANPHLVLTPADVASLPTSFSSTFGAAQAPPHQHNGTPEMTRGYLESVHLDTTSPLSLPSSPSPSIMSSSSSMSVWNHPHPSAPPLSASSRSRSYPVYHASAPMGTVSEATVLWMVCNVPLAQISSMLPRVLSLPEPETELSVLVLRECRGRHRVTAAEVNGFETMVYNESVDERWRGRRHRQRQPRRRSHS